MDKVLPYDLDQRISILQLQKADAVYNWAEQKAIWGGAEPQTGKNLFSTVGIGAKSVKFTVWKQGITLHNAFRWCGKFCFLTDMTEINRMYYEIMAAMVEPKICTVKRKPKRGKDEFNRPQKSELQTVMSFPGCIVEKYMGFTKLDPQTQIDAQYVLVTPKAVSLQFADLVTIGGAVYNVQVLHELDEFKNEYEIAVKKDG